MANVRTLGWRYGGASALTLIALLVRLLSTPLLGLQGPFVTFYIAIVISAYFLGAGPAVLTALLGAALGNYFLLTPLGSLWVEQPTDQVWLFFYFLVSATVIAAIDAQKRTVERLQLETAERKRAQEAEAEQRQWFETTLRSISDAVIATNNEARVTFMNGAAETLTGWTLEEASGRPIAEVFHIQNEETGAPAEIPVEKVLRDGRVAGLANHTILLSRSGVAYPIDDGAAPIRRAGGEITGVVLIFRDIGERRRAERALAQSAAEMERFAYLASHDLQEPLRTVASFASLVERRYAGALDQSGAEYVRFIRDGIRRMQALVADLLIYCRSGASAVSIQEVSAEAILHEAIESLRSSIDAAGASVTHAELPHICADRVKMVQVFQNLIGNSIKFRSERPCQVHVSAAQQDGMWTFSVQDNGLGFDGAVAERIFGIFERLHTDDRYPGSGIGLALSKRVIESHNGRIWATSIPGEGSTFLFTLPVAHPQPGSTARS